MRVLDQWAPTIYDCCEAGTPGGHMSPEERARLRALCEAATPGPWLQPLEDEPRAIVSAVDPAVSLLGLDRDRMAIVAEESDAALIVATRNALPELLAEIARLIGERDMARLEAQTAGKRLAQERGARLEERRIVAAAIRFWEAWTTEHEDAMGRALGDELTRQWLVGDDGLISETGEVLLAAIDSEIGRVK